MTGLFENFLLWILAPVTAYLTGLFAEEAAAGFFAWIGDFLAGLFPGTA